MDLALAFDKKQDSLNFLSFLNKRHCKFTIEKQINHSTDIFILDVDNQDLTLQTYHKSTHIELLLNSKSFISFPYKVKLNV